MDYRGLKWVVQPPWWCDHGRKPTVWLWKFSTSPLRNLRSAR